MLVIGLGRFGSAIAQTLEKLGREVLAVESAPALAQYYSSRFPVVEGDATNPDALEQLGARDFPTAVVGIGSSLESSVLVTGNLVDIGTPHIWAKAVSAEHGRILQRIGAHHVVYPEYDAGTRVAHLVSERMLDYIEMENNFAITKMRAPRELHNRTIGEINISKRYGVMVIYVKHPGEAVTYANAETLIRPGDILIVSGDTNSLEEFARVL